MEFVEGIDVESYLQLREIVGWTVFPVEQAQAGLDHSRYIISCKDQGKVVGTARLIWDGGYVAYIADVMVMPEYQRKGIGKQLMQSILDYLEAQMKEGWKIMISLMAAKGKEPFYEGFNFIKRPNEQYGAGMIKWINK